MRPPGGWVGPRTEAGWKYLVMPISATTAKICDHNGLSFKHLAHGAAVNWALANLDSERITLWYKQEVKLVCLDFPFNLETEIKPSDLSYLNSKHAMITQPNSTNLTALYKWDEDDELAPLVNAEVDGGYWYGNKNNNINGYGLFVHNTSGVNNEAIVARNIHLGSVDEDAFHIQLANSQRMMLINNHTSGIDMPPEGVGGRGIYIRSVGDAWIQHGSYQCSLEGMYADLIGDLVVEGTYFGGSSATAPTDSQVYVRGCKRIGFEGVWMMDGNKHGLVVVRSGVDFESFGVRVVGSVVGSDNTVTDDLYDCIRLEDETRDCIIQGNYLGYKNRYISGNKYKYAVNENSPTCNDNHIGPNATYQIKTSPPYRVQGTRTRVYPEQVLTTTSALTGLSPARPLVEGAILPVYSTHATDGGYRMFHYINGGWRVVEVT